MSEHLVGNRFNLKWKLEHDGLLKAQREAGYSASQIAGQLYDQFRASYSRNAVIGRLHRLGLTHQPRKQHSRRRTPKQFNPRPRKAQMFECQESSMPRCVEIEPRLLMLQELSKNDCRYPYGDSAPFLFCGCPVMVEDCSWCPDHYALTHGAGTTSERRATS